MKKNIIILGTVLITLGLTAFGVRNWNDSTQDQVQTLVSDDVAINTQVIGPINKRIFSDFIYDVGPRFGPIKKGDLDKARTFDDFISDEHAKQIVSYKSLSVIYIINDKQSDIRETGYSDALTAAQLELLQSADYSTNFLIRAEYQQKNKETGVLEDSYSTPHLTIVPEKQAAYVYGKDALIEYLKENSQRVRTNVIADKLQPAKLFFTVTKIGTIENVKLDRSSNFPAVDKKMIELISKTTGTWEPAKSLKGEKVDQELVVSFGLMGC